MGSEQVSSNPLIMTVVQVPEISFFPPLLPLLPLLPSSSPLLVDRPALLCNAQLQLPEGGVGGPAVHAHIQTQQDVEGGQLKAEKVSLETERELV